MRRPGAWQTNDRLATQATRNLVDAAITGGVEVFVQESISVVYANGGAQWLEESAEGAPPFAAARSALVQGGRPVVVGRGANYVSSLHAEDAGTAVAAALAVPAGVYNVGDDEPVTALRLAATLAAPLGALPPRRVPAWVAPSLLGGMARLLTVSQRVSNQAIRQAAGWEPRYRSVEIGWPTLLTRHRRSG
jgi:2-alkyl-3-oxoalkanoate reductase